MAADDQPAEFLKLHPEAAGPVYEAAEARRSASNQLMWQVPALSLGAQSFLLTVALAADTSLAGRIVACVVGVGAALATAQLMLKHRYYAIEQSIWLMHFWNAQDWGQGMNPHYLPQSPKAADNPHPMLQARHGEWLAGEDLNGAFRSIVDWKSPTMWIRFFVLLAAVDFAVGGLAIADVIR